MHFHRLSLGVWVEDQAKQTLAHLDVITAGEGGIHAQWG